MHPNMADVAGQGGRFVESLYSLYDALVSINVPNDKARALVDAMERDMISQLATKSDLQFARELLAKDIQHQTTLMTVRLGSMLILGIGVLYTLLKLT